MANPILVRLVPTVVRIVKVAIVVAPHLYAAYQAHQQAKPYQPRKYPK